MGYKFDDIKAWREPLSTAKSLLCATLIPYLVLCSLVIMAYGVETTSAVQALLLGDPSSLAVMSEVLWFLPALLVADVLFASIMLLVPRYRFLPIMAIGLIGTMVPSMPWQLQAALLSQPLLYLGYAFARSPLSQLDESGPLTLIMGAGMMSAAAVLIGPASFSASSPSNYALFLIGSIGGGLILLQLGRWMSRIDSKAMAELFGLFAKHVAAIPSFTIAFVLLIHFLVPMRETLPTTLSVIGLGIVLSLCLCWCIDHISHFITSRLIKRNEPAAVASLFHLPVSSSEQRKK